jgi:hypothetical protein
LWLFCSENDGLGNLDTRLAMVLPSLPPFPPSLPPFPNRAAEVKRERERRESQETSWKKEGEKIEEGKEKRERDRG